MGPSEAEPIDDAGPAVVRAIYCQRLIELLAIEGIPDCRVLAGTGLSAAGLNQTDGRISHRQQQRIYENARALSTTPDLGFQLGRRQSISDQGVFGYAIQSSVDLRQALRIVIEYQATAGPLLDMAFESSDETASVVLAEPRPLGEIAAMAREEVLVLILEHLLSATQPATTPSEIMLDLDDVDADLYRARLGCPVRFGQPRCEIRIRPQDLDRPLRFSDEETARVCERRCQDILERLGARPPFIESLRRTLVGTPGHFPNLDETARAHGLSGRTLRRRLAELGTSYQEISIEVRKSLAIDYLQLSNLSIDEIASLLGYTETPNFFRAFKKWTGRPPGEYRSRR